MSRDLAGSFEERPSDVSIPIPQIKTQVLGESLDLGMKELNAIVKNMVHVTINFFVSNVRNVCHLEFHSRKNEGRRRRISHPG